MPVLQDKVVIVTGGNKGIGRAAALLFAREGAKVVVAARHADGSEDDVVRDIHKTGGTAIFAQTDIAEAADCERLVERTLAEFGRLDLAFNNAGTHQELKSIPDLPTEEWDRVMAVNLRGTFLSMKYQIPAMLQNGGGTILNTSSIGGLVASPFKSAYQASKHGIIGLTKVAAMEFAQRNIRVNALCPGGTHTRILDQWISHPATESFRMAHPMARFSLPGEQAQAALFLLSDAASFITGAALPVDGGFVAQ